MDLFSLSLDSLPGYLSTDCRTDWEAFVSAIAQQRDSAAAAPPKLPVETISRLRHYADAMAKAADEALSDLNPHVVLKSSLIEGILRKSEFSLLRHIGPIGMSRFGWIAAAAGGGSSSSRAVLRRYLAATQAWLAAQSCIDEFVPVDTDVPLDVGLNRSHEDLRRLLGLEIRYSWVSRLICTSAAREVDSKREYYRGLDILTISSVGDLFDLAHRALRLSLSKIVPLSDRLSMDAHQLAQGMSIDAGGLSGTPFLKLATSRQLEQKPFVRFHRGLSVPVAFHDAALNLDQALFELARERLPSEKHRSDLYEEVITRALRAVGPVGLDEVTPPLSIRVPGSANPGETDFAFTLGRHLILGEAKAYFVPSASGTVINSFADQVEKAVKQLTARLDAFRSGSPLVGSNMVVQHGADQDALGVAVPLHSYGTVIWAPEIIWAPEMNMGT